MKILLTGITGLVGASVVTAILRDHDDLEIVAVCRPGRGISAQDRVVKVIHDQCAFDGVPELAEKILRHIRVIGGDIHTVSLDGFMHELRPNDEKTTG